MRFAREFLSDSAFCALSSAAQVILVDYMRKFTGKNNGQIYYPVALIAKDHRISQRTACSAINVLIEAEFMHITKIKSWDGEKRYLARKFHVRTVGTKKGHSAAGYQLALVRRDPSFSSPPDDIYKKFLKNDLPEDHPQYKHCTERQRRSLNRGNVRLLLSVIKSKRYRDLPIKPGS